MDVDVKPSPSGLSTAETAVDVDSHGVQKAVLPTVLSATENCDSSMVKTEPSLPAQPPRQGANVQRGVSKTGVPASKAAEVGSSLKVAVVTPTNRQNNSANNPDRPWGVQAWLEHQEQVG